MAAISWQVLLRAVCSEVGAVWRCQISALNQKKVIPIFNRMHLSLRAHSVSLHVVTGRGGQDSEAEGRERCGSTPPPGDLAS